jgi:hypothetical protein
VPVTHSFERVDADPFPELLEHRLTEWSGVKIEQRKQRRLQIGAAALGAGVLIAMAVITTAGSGDPITSSEPPTGETTTETNPALDSGNH